MLASLGLLVLGGFFMSRLKPQFFPKDLQYLSYVEIWLPEDAPLTATREVASQAEQVIQREAREYFAHHSSEHGEGGMVPLTTFIGGGGRALVLLRSGAAPEPLRAHRNADQEQVGHALAGAGAPGQGVPADRGSAGGRGELENGPPVGVPVAIRLSGDHIPTLRALSGELMGILRRNPYAERVHEDWGNSSLAVHVTIDPDRANQAGLTNADVAVSTAVGLNGLELTSMYYGDQIVPILARLRMEERARLADLRNLYVYSSEGGQKVSLPQIASLSTELRPERIERRNQFRTITVQAFPIGGAIPSEVLAHSWEEIQSFAAGLPPGVRLEIAGEHEEQQEGFAEMTLVLSSASC